MRQVLADLAKGVRSREDERRPSRERAADEAVGDVGGKAEAVGLEAAQRGELGRAKIMHDSEGSAAGIEVVLRRRIERVHRKAREADPGTGRRLLAIGLKAGGDGNRGVRAGVDVHLGAGRSQGLLTQVAGVVSRSRAGEAHVRNVAICAVGLRRNADRDLVADWAVRRGCDLAQIVTAVFGADLEAALLGRVIGRDADGASLGVLAEQRALRAAQDFDAREVEEADVEGALWQRHAVDVVGDRWRDQGRGRADAANVQQVRFGYARVGKIEVGD